MRLVILFVAITIATSCSVLNKGKVSHKQLSDEEQIEYDYSFAEAQKQVLLGNYTKAKSLYLRCIELKPASGASNFQLANLYITTGKYDRALGYARQAVKLDDKNEWFLLQLAQIYQVRENIDSVLYIYKKIIEVKPNKYEYRLALALLYLKTKKLNAALDILNKIEADQGPNNETIISRYKIYILKNDNEKCIKVLKDAIAKFPYESQYYGLLGEHYAAIKQNDLALTYFNKLIDLDPDNEKGYLSLIDFYKSTGKIDQSVDVAKGFINNKLIPVKFKLEVVSSYCNDRKVFNQRRADIKAMVDSLYSFEKDNLGVLTLRADYYILTNQLLEAYKDLEVILSRTKLNPLVWEQFFYVLSNLNDFQSVFSFSDEAISYFDKNPLFYLYKGIAAYQLKKYNAAVAALENGLPFAEGLSDILVKMYSFLGEAYHALRDYTKSDKYFEKALSIDIRNVLVLNNYSYYLSLRNEKLDKALFYIKKCLENEPKSSTFLDTYGWVLFKMGKLDDAKKAIEDAFANGGKTNVEILEHYAEIMIVMKNNDEAMKYYKLMKELGKDSNRIRELLNLAE